MLFSQAQPHVLSFSKGKIKGLIFLVLFFTVLGSATATYFLFKKDLSAHSTDQPQVLGDTTSIKDSTPLDPADPNLKTLNILLLGYGGAGHDGGLLTDVIQIAHFDFDKKQLALISIPRDLWATLPDGKNNKINEAYVLDHDSASQVRHMAEVVTGLRIDYFIAIDFVGFKRTVGQVLKGIEVDVPATLDDPWYPLEGEQLNPCGMSPQEVAQLSSQYSGFELEKQFPCRYKHLHFEQGINHMEGGDALEYVRSRHGSSNGDFDRSLRQRAVLLGIQKKLFSLDVAKNLPEFFEQVSQQVHSDIDLKIAQYLFPALQASQDFTVKGITISTENVLTSSKASTGQFILIPKQGLNNWTNVQQYVEKELEK